MNINYKKEPTDLQCGQAVLAMVLSKDIKQVIEELQNDRETTLKEMKDYLRKYNAEISDERREVKDKSELPNLCLLSLETPRCWHWSLYHDGTFYDPEHGIMQDFPACNRKYCWEIKKEDTV